MKTKTNLQAMSLNFTHIEYVPAPAGAEPSRVFAVNPAQPPEVAATITSLYRERPMHRELWHVLGTAGLAPAPAPRASHRPRSASPLSEPESVRVNLGATRPRGLLLETEIIWCPWPPLHAEKGTALRGC